MSWRAGSCCIELLKKRIEDGGEGAVVTGGYYHCIMRGEGSLEIHFEPKNEGNNWGEARKKALVTLQRLANADTIIWKFSEEKGAARDVCKIANEIFDGYSEKYFSRLFENRLLEALDRVHRFVCKAASLPRENKELEKLVDKIKAKQYTFKPSTTGEEPCAKSVDAPRLKKKEEVAKLSEEAVLAVRKKMREALFLNNATREELDSIKSAFMHYNGLSKETREDVIEGTLRWHKYASTDAKVGELQKVLEQTQSVLEDGSNLIGSFSD